MVKLSPTKWGRPPWLCLDSSHPPKKLKHVHPKQDEMTFAIKEHMENPSRFCQSKRQNPRESCCFLSCHISDNAAFHLLRLTQFKFMGQFLNKQLHPRSLTFSPLKNDGWKTILSFWDGTFSGAMYVHVTSGEYKKRKSANAISNTWIKIRTPT